MRYALALLAAMILASAPAYACSVKKGYRVPTTLELAEKADSIVIATVLGPAGNPEQIHRNDVSIEPTDMLKGAPPPFKTLVIPGMIAHGQYAEAKSDPHELREAHPLAFIGGCIRFFYPAKGTILFFLAKHEAGFVQIAEPFARVAEDVSGPDSRWAKAVKLYVEIAALPKDRRKAALIARRDALRRETGDADAQAIAADIDVELASPPKAKWIAR